MVGLERVTLRNKFFLKNQFQDPSRVLLGEEERSSGTEMARTKLNLNSLNDGQLLLRRRPRKHDFPELEDLVELRFGKLPELVAGDDDGRVLVGIEQAKLDVRTHGHLGEVRD